MDGFLHRDTFRRKFDTFKLSKYGCKGKALKPNSNWNVNLNGTSKAGKMQIELLNL